MAKSKQHGNPLGFLVTVLAILFTWLGVGTEFEDGWNFLFGIVAMLLWLLRLEITISGRGFIRLP